MPLDQHVKQLVDMMVASGSPPLWQLTPEQARIGLDGAIQQLDAKGVEIGGVEDGHFAGPQGRLAYRLYTPVDAAKSALPGIVYLPGGGFVLGSVETHDGFLRLLANASGCRVAAIEYRRAPEAVFPAALDDASAALSHIASSPDIFRMDPERMVIAGDSAGATIAVVTALSAAQGRGPKVRLLVLLCPWLTPHSNSLSRRTFAEGPFLDTKSLGWFSGHTYPPGTDYADPRVSPLLAPDLSLLPETHIHTAECDLLRDDGYEFAGRLQEHGVKVRYTCHPGMIHHFYGMAMAIPYARKAIGEFGSGIRQALL